MRPNLAIFSRRSLRPRAKGSALSTGDVFYYPPESTATNRIAINLLDEARTAEGEYLNDNLMDLFLRYLYVHVAICAVLLRTPTPTPASPPRYSDYKNFIKTGPGQERSGCD